MILFFIASEEKYANYIVTEIKDKTLVQDLEVLIQKK